MEVFDIELNSTSAYVPAELTKGKLLLWHIDSLTKSNIKIDKIALPTFYWLPRLHNTPYKSHPISNFSHCSTTILSKHITSALTTVKYHVINYSETAFSKSYVWINFGLLKTLPRSSKICGGETFRVLKYLRSIVLYYTHPCYKILSKKKCCLLKRCFYRESKTYLCTSYKAKFFYNKLYDLHWV